MIPLRVCNAVVKQAFVFVFHTNTKNLLENSFTPRDNDVLPQDTMRHYPKTQQRNQHAQQRGRQTHLPYEQLGYLEL